MEARKRFLRTLQAKLVLDLAWESVGSCFEVEQYFLLEGGFVKLGEDCPDEFKRVVRNFQNFSKRVEKIPNRCKSLFYGRYVKPPIQPLSDALIFWQTALGCSLRKGTVCSGKCSPSDVYNRLEDAFTWFGHLNSDAGLVLFHYFSKFWNFVPENPRLMEDYYGEIKTFWSFVEPIWDTYLRENLNFLKPYRYDRNDDN